MSLTKKSKVFFRVDGNKEIGLGHIYRCLALASFIQDENDIVFIFQERITPLNIREIVEHEALLIPDNVSMEDEYIHLRDTIQASKSMIVLDGYNLSLIHI